MNTPIRDPAPPSSHAQVGASALERWQSQEHARRTAERTNGSWPLSPAIGGREIAAACTFGVVLALIATWPLVLHLGTRISPDLGDPVRTAWQVAWIGHALVHDPLHLFNSNAFYAQRHSLAFSDSLLGYGPAGLFGSGTVAALVRYNILFLFIWSLCFVGTYLLARELGLSRAGAALAGIAFAYAPYRATEAGHFQVISSGGIALALFLLVRGYRRRSAPLVLAGWLVSAWQLSLGWTLGLQYGYLLALLALLAGLAWWRRRAAAKPSRAPRVAPGGELRRLLIVTTVGLAACGVVAVYQGIPYLQVAHEHSAAARGSQEVQKYSAGLVAFLAAPASNPIWGAATAPFRKRVSSADESVLFPGLVISLLALLGVLAGHASPYPRGLRFGLATGALACALLALGFGLGGAGYPYRLIYDHAPGFSAVRVPGRIFTLTTLCLALLAGAGLQSLLDYLAARRHRTAGALAALCAGALLGATFAEGTRNLPERVVPQPSHAEIGLPAPILDLPTDSPADRLWQYFSTDGFYAIPVGDSTFDLPALDDLRGGMASFPDRASIAKLRWYGVRAVVLHTSMPALPGLGTSGPEPADPAAAALKPVGGLGVSRQRVGSIVIYRIGLGPKALHVND